MSRVAKNPIVLPKGVELTVSGQQVQVKGGKGNMSIAVHESVDIVQNDSELTFAGKKDGDKQGNAMAGTMRALVNNMVTGVSTGHERRLQLQGVGYRAQAQGIAVVSDTASIQPHLDPVTHLRATGKRQLPTVNLNRQIRIKSKYSTTVD